MEAVLATLPQAQIERQASTDRQVIEMWLHGRCENTRQAYQMDVDRLFELVGVGIRQLTLGDLQAFADSLSGADTTRARVLASVKSLLKFAHRLGYTPFDVGAPLRLPKIENKLAERIMTEDEMLRLLYNEKHPRNVALLRMLYKSGCRVSELCALKWRNIRPCVDNEECHVTLFGKGGKTRTVLIPADTWTALQSIRGEAGPDDPVFASRKQHGHLTASQVLRIVRRAARRAGITGNVSPHWFRHAHASHAIDNGATLPLIAETLGHSSVATTSKYLHAKPGESSGKYLRG